MLANSHRQSKARSNARASRLSPAASVRAFTLVELMIVVVIMGVLATLGTYGVRKYLMEAKKAEAASMITQIRAAEETYRDETFQYLGVANFTEWHPVNNPGRAKYSWGAASPNAVSTVFNRLGVLPTGAVQYAYSVVAGLGGGALPAIPTTTVFNFPTPPGPFYIAMAKADLNGDGVFTYALSHSDSSEIYIDPGY